MIGILFMSKHQSNLHNHFSTSVHDISSHTGSVLPKDVDKLHHGSIDLTVDRHSAVYNPAIVPHVEHLSSQTNMERLASNRREITESNKVNRKRKYTKRNRCNSHGLNILFVIDSLRPYSKKVLYKRSGGPWDKLNKWLDYWVARKVLDYESEVESTLGDETYTITEFGLQVRSQFWSADPVQKEIRDSLGAEEPKVEEFYL